MTGSTVNASTFAAKPDITYYGYVGSGKVILIALTFEQQKSEWIPLGDSYHGYTITGLNTDENAITVKDSGNNIFIFGVSKNQPGDNTSILSKKIDVIKISQNAFTTDEKSNARDAKLVAYPPRGTIRSMEGLDWEWIKSNSNPMKELPFMFKGTLTKRWRNMNDTDKAEFVELYRQCGWNITVFDDEDKNHGVGTEYKEIEQKEGRQPDKAKGPIRQGL